MRKILKRIGRAGEACSGALRRNEAVAELWKACVRLQGALRKRKPEKQSKPKQGRQKNKMSDIMKKI